MSNPKYHGDIPVYQVRDANGDYIREHQELLAAIDTIVDSHKGDERPTNVAGPLNGKLLNKATMLEDGSIEVSIHVCSDNGYGWRCTHRYNITRNDYHGTTD